MAHDLAFDPTTDTGRAIVELFNELKDLEHGDGSLPGTEAVMALNQWFERLGIDVDAPPIGLTWSPQTGDPDRDHALRQAVILQALAHIETTDPDTVREQLAGTDLCEQYRADPAALAAALRQAVTGRNGRSVYAAWQHAGIVLRAAGLPDAPF